MGIKNQLLIADVAHARKRPRHNHFCYKVFYLCFAVSQQSALKRLLLSLNRWNIFSFYDRDHKVDIHALLKEWNIPQADGEVVLLTMPRVLGYVFNPVSFWFCLDRQGRLRAVLSEVNNTFGDSHCYISFHDDRRPIERDDILRSEKVFHVSPFLHITGHYQFRFVYGESAVGAWIDYYDEEGLMLTTSLTGKRVPLTSLTLAVWFIRYPFMTLKVIVLIHYQALKIWLKKIRYVPHTPPPAIEVSR